MDADVPVACCHMDHTLRHGATSKSKRPFAGFAAVEAVDAWASSQNTSAHDSTNSSNETRRTAEIPSLWLHSWTWVARSATHFALLAGALLQAPHTACRAHTLSLRGSCILFLLLKQSRQWIRHPRHGDSVAAALSQDVAEGAHARTVSTCQGCANQASQACHRQVAAFNGKMRALFVLCRNTRHLTPSIGSTTLSIHRMHNYTIYALGPWWSVPATTALFSSIQSTHLASASVFGIHSLELAMPTTDPPKNKTKLSVTIRMCNAFPRQQVQLHPLMTSGGACLQAFLNPGSRSASSNLTSSDISASVRYLGVQSEPCQDTGHDKDQTTRAPQQTVAA